MDSFWVDLILKALVLIVIAVWGWFKARYHLAEGKRAKMTAIAEEAVTDTYLTFVREIKRESEDGRLTLEEVIKARDMAWGCACDIAREKGIDFAKEVAKQYFPVIIDKVIKSLKKNK